MHQAGQRRQIGIVLVVECVLLAAQHDKCIMVEDPAWQATIDPGPEILDLGIRFGQCNAERSERGAFHVFDNGNPHRRLLFDLSRKGNTKPPGIAICIAQRVASS
jgi:hypothetical protein